MNEHTREQSEGRSVALMGGPWWGEGMWNYLPLPPIAPGIDSVQGARLGASSLETYGPVERRALWGATAHACQESWPEQD